MVVDRCRAGLDDVDVLLAHQFLDLNVHFCIGEAVYQQPAQRQPQAVSHGLGQRPVRPPRKDIHVILRGVSPGHILQAHYVGLDLINQSGGVTRLPVAPVYLG